MNEHPLDFVVVPEDDYSQAGACIDMLVVLADALSIASDNATLPTPPRQLARALHGIADTLCATRTRTVSLPQAARRFAAQLEARP